MIPVYLANTENTFEKVLMYNGYLPTTHEGLIETIDEAAPFSTPAMVSREKTTTVSRTWRQHWLRNSRIAAKCTAPQRATTHPTRAIRNTTRS